MGNHGIAMNHGHGAIPNPPVPDNPVPPSGHHSIWSHMPRELRPVNPTPPEQPVAPFTWPTVVAIALTSAMGGIIVLETIRRLIRRCRRRRSNLDVTEKTLD